MNVKKSINMSLATIGIAVIGFPSFAAALTTTEKVREADVTRQAENTPPSNEWVIYNRAAGKAEFKTGPATPPIGKGSLELKTPTGIDKIYAFNYDHIGEKLSDVKAMAYESYRSAGTGQQVAAINMQVDFNGTATGGFTTLVFEPVYNPDQGAVVNDKWQKWDAYKSGEAIWWSSNPIASAPNRDTFVSWDTIVKANPSAVVLGGYGVNQGSGNPAVTTAVDALKIGIAGNETIYDFEPTLVNATSKEDCKNDGYKEFTANYKNQGACVSSVVSNSDKSENTSMMQRAKDLLGL